MKLIYFLILSTLFSLQAAIEHAPLSFKYGNKQVQFVDFIDVDTSIEYDLDAKLTTAQSIIHFKMAKKGYPLFDTKAAILLAKINDIPVDIKTINSPDQVTKYQMVDHELPAGEHKLYIKNKIEENQSYAWNGTRVQAAFWMSDLKDRKYLEQYLPTNLEFDQYQMSMEIKLEGTKKIAAHTIYTNGFKTIKGPNHFKIDFPEYFTTSSFYYHLTREDKFSRDDFRFNSISGKEVPVTIYSVSKRSIAKAKKKAKVELAELEQKLGPWPHPSLVIYVAGPGGMEHAGATITAVMALGHELTHSYFARGVMPMNGNSGWIDEAIASWRDNGYNSTRYPNFSSSQMGGHSQYQRTTDSKAYKQGANFMAFLNHKLTNQGGLIEFLKLFHKNYVHKNITTAMFKKELELFSGMDFTKDFAKHIYGQGLNIQRSLEVEDNPLHPRLSKEELLNLL